MDIPDGFHPYEASAFAVTFGPVFRAEIEGVPVLGVRADVQHVNTMGGVHGGLLLALGDTALGNLVKTVIGDAAIAVTVDFHTSFMVGARLGQWIEVRPTLDRKGRTMVFASGDVTADGQTIGRVHASFYVHYRSSIARGEPR